MSEEDRNDSEPITSYSSIMWMFSFLIAFSMLLCMENPHDQVFLGRVYNENYIIKLFLKQKKMMEEFYMQHNSKH